MANKQNNKKIIIIIFVERFLRWKEAQIEAVLAMTILSPPLPLPPRGGRAPYEKVGVARRKV